eukprot:TRINITY_DN4476_c0_g1_i1.p1 TRINITY_DN4476_c0_g1~~TRINITY_DN4476_c0_g1_i1.p1  ORF type:complete len:152 (-),score=46.00 TRINITY_DN4476_c0_g1_i1:79-534(-)
MDMKNVRKEINMISEKLNRTFAVVEEMIFQDAKKDPTGAQTYKLTVTLNQIFTELTEVMTKTGQAANASLHLTDKIDKLQARTTALNMQQIEEDLRQVREENQKLIEKYKDITKGKTPKIDKSTKSKKSGVSKRLVVEEAEDDGRYASDDE